MEVIGASCDGLCLLCEMEIFFWLPRVGGTQHHRTIVPTTVSNDKIPRTSHVQVSAELLDESLRQFGGTDDIGRGVEFP